MQNIKAKNQMELESEGTFGVFLAARLSCSSGAKKKTKVNINPKP